MKDKDDVVTYIKEYVKMINMQQPGQGVADAF
jgi:hypothetical protein